MTKYCGSGDKWHLLHLILQ